ncbi:hypothetical protein PGT21_033142 [Puccinia graminis f. sp. tritici]|uniref:Uncharacterized protein n=1 Tax=Puccinia graminis f. sp. tritici TaxID=56615 RepID=A0A5B0M5C6_PUCGR|nr:hypothetical protein PGT21_033142 [Puccinia graminis f. sp. tritici]
MKWNFELGCLTQPGWLLTIHQDRNLDRAFVIQNLMGKELFHIAGIQRKSAKSLIQIRNGHILFHHYTSQKMNLKTAFKLL